MKLAFVPLAVILWLCWITAANYRKLSLAKSDVELDKIDQMLAGIKDKLPMDAKIGFRTNIDPGRRGVLYFKSTLILAPRILENNDRDTILLIEDPHLQPVLDKNYECLERGGNQELNYCLMRRRN
ncbi:hypothetical protein FEN17_02630 [Dyadobacter luticola]|uniref:Uncharacterized protein n=1 Tax=Dyadobacter luticola TaxID=1979387 RepID=A0A5R9L1V7_9BACT|nr:hypothetical protein FEN17_02630 [Dyadobacter luticola]